MNKTFAAVIPTKNRPHDLLVAVKSILKQDVLPTELIIVDQSSTDASKIQVKNLCSEYNYMQLKYVYDPKIRGLVHAKKVACDLSLSDIICFLEDDIELETDYFSVLIEGFNQNPLMMGCSGIITNPLPRSKFHKFIFHLFHIGLFRDIRFDYYGLPKGSINDCILSNKISGGLSAWKKEVFKFVQFNEDIGLFMLEDIEFSMRVDDHFKNSLFINPQARLEHFWSPINRDKELIRFEKKLTENFIFFSTRPKTFFNYLSFCWLLFGFFIESSLLLFVKKSTLPIKAFFLVIIKRVF